MVLRRIIDSRDVGKVLNTMHWHVHTLPDDGQCSFITGDLPILISGGLGRRDAFVVLAISPSSCSSRPVDGLSFTHSCP
jgi:hypothetical protein